MSPLELRQVLRLSLALLTALAMLSLSACDHAKDLVEQGKKQAEDIQKSIEGKTEPAAAPSSASTGSASSSPTSSSPPAASPPAAQPAPASADPNLLVETFLKGAVENKTDGILRALGALPEEYRAKIEVCDLSGGTVTDVGLAEVVKFPNMKLLNLTGCGRITSSGLAVFKDLKQLESLLAEHGIVGDAELNYVRELTNLKVLNLNHTSVTDVGLARLNTLTHLEELHISSTSVNGSCFLKAPWMGSLRVLMANLTTVGQDVKVMKKFHDLEELGLYKAQVTDQTVVALKGSGKLRKLYLGENRLTDLGVKQLSGLINMEDLSLGKNQVTDNCLPTFKVCKKLAHFGEGETGITAAGRDFIKKISPECTFDTK
jgi:hypothetical protein